MSVPGGQAVKTISDRRAAAFLHGAGRAQAGFSMIEMMVSVVLSLMVMAAVMYTVTNAGASGRKQEVRATGHDLGNLAMFQLAEHLRMSGFSTPGSEVMASDLFAEGGTSIMGCRNGFADLSSAWDDLSCANGRGSNDAIALRFQPGLGGRNWDCLGNSVIDQRTADLLAKAPPPPPNQTDSGRKAPEPPKVQDEIREVYYLKTSGTQSGNPGLFCRSNADSSREQLIADNVDQMVIRYGLSALNSVEQIENRPFDQPLLTGNTVMYRSADQLSRDCTPGSMPANSWCAVNTVQICLVMRSNDNVNEEAGTPYVDCTGTVRTVNDRRFRQAFRMTVAIRNKVGEDRSSAGAANAGKGNNRTGVANP